MATILDHGVLPLITRLGGASEDECSKTRGRNRQLPLALSAHVN